MLIVEKTFHTAMTVLADTCQNIFIYPMWDALRRTDQMEGDGQDGHPFCLNLWRTT